MRYELVTEEDVERGSTGAVIQGWDRPDFQPARGLQLAHDILEHPAKKHKNPFVDELMALGGMTLLRMENGYPASRLRALDGTDIASDIHQMLWDDRFSIDRPQKTVNAPSIGHYLDQAYEESLMLVETEWDTDDQGRVRQEIEENWPSIRSWICQGYKAARKRYLNLDTYTLAYGLFNDIAREVDDWLKWAEVGDTATLQVKISQYEASLKTPYE